MKENFPTVTDKEWKQKLQFLLDGKDYNKTLQWKSDEEIIVNPFYSGENIQQKFNFSKVGTQLIIYIYVNEVQKCIEELAKYNQKSIQYFILNVPNKELCTSLLLRLPAEYQYIVKLSNYSIFDAKLYHSIIKNRNLKVIFGCDILGNFTRFGNWFYDRNQDLSNIPDFLGQEISSLTIDTTIFQESGATIIQQVAYSVLLFTEYSKYIRKFNYPKKLILYISVGNNYFFEIAKLKALRWIFESLIKMLKYPFELELIAYPSRRELTLFNVDRNSAKIELALESCILGNADYVMPMQSEFYKKENFERLKPYLDYAYSKLKLYDDDFHIIEDSFYIEALIHEIVDKSLKLSQELQHLGGYLDLLKSNALQRKIRKKADNNSVISKSNKEYITEEEWEIFPFLKKKIRKTLITPIYPIRKSEKEEKKYYKK